MSISSSPPSADAEADRLCLLVATNVDSLRTPRLGSKFSLDGLTFRIHGKARNTIYRVSGRYDWFLKLPRSGGFSAMERESIGAQATRAAFSDTPDYAGATVTRASTDPAFVLAAAIPGKPLNAVLFTECWLPGKGVSDRLERSFGTLGSLLATLHLRGHVGPETPPATTRPFQMLKSLLDARRDSDEITTAISVWHETAERSDDGETFLHGNFRLDNIVRVDARLGFLDFENCGTGSFYQDLSRPVSELLLTRCVAPFPHCRERRWLRAFLATYSEMHPYEPAVLWIYVGARLARYYLEYRRSSGFLHKRIGGLPVMRRRLDRFILDVVSRPFEDVVPEIGLR